MSEKAEQNAPERCSCCTCGYTWVKGQHGGHSCAQVMEVTVADLRARLAKYEDAEGRALQPAADLARRIDQAITEFTSGRACMHVPPRDTDVDIVLSECLKLANAMESQAREIDDLQEEVKTGNECLDMANEMVGKLKGRIAALKAQPSEAIPSQQELIKWALSWRESDRRDGLSVEDDIIERITYAIHSGMRYRLNSSPVREDVREVVTSALVSMIASVTNMIPPTDQPLPDFVQSPIDRAVDRISAMLAATPSAGSQEQGE